MASSGTAVTLKTLLKNRKNHVINVTTVILEYLGEQMQFEMCLQPSDPCREEKIKASDAAFDLPALGE